MILMALLMDDLNLTSLKYDNIWGKCEFRLIGSRSMSQMLLLEKLFHGSSFLFVNRVLQDFKKAPTCKG